MRNMCHSLDSRQSALISHLSNLHVTQQNGSRDDECLDEDCCAFCNGCEKGFLPKELDCSSKEFSLNMDKLRNDFKPFSLGSFTITARNATPYNSPQAIRGNLCQVGYTNNTHYISDPRLLIYPSLLQRVEGYFKSRPPTPQGWTWTVNPPSMLPLTTAQTDSVTVNSGNSHGTALSYSCSSCSLVQGGTSGRLEQSTVLNTIKEICDMRDCAIGVKPFDPSRYITHPYRTPNVNGSNYLGTMSISSNQVSNLPEFLNTCVWVEGAPADLTHQEMLQSIRNCGKIYSLHINPARQKHLTAAAKIAFCTRIGAERFLNQAQSKVGVNVRGWRLFVRWNRNKYRENLNRAESRVLRITGPRKFVNRMTMERYFECLFYFNLIRVDELSPGVAIWEFGSILAQAHSAKQAIEREPAFNGLIRVEYEKDPCE